MEKWQTFPCKECLLKGRCSGHCFDWPHYDIVKKQIEDNQLEGMCLSCGSYLNNPTDWIFSCYKCNTWSLYK